MALMKRRGLDVFDHGFEFLTEARDIDQRPRAPDEIRNLTVDAAPITGIVGIEVDTHRETSGPSRQHGIDILRFFVWPGNGSGHGFSLRGNEEA
jgi:hypothetical protein